MLTPKQLHKDASDDATQEATSSNSDLVNGERRPFPRLKTTLPNTSPSSVILDVDLDFFSTLNPFKVMLTPKQFDLLQKVYFFRFPEPRRDYAGGDGVHAGGNGVLEDEVARKALRERRAQVCFMQRSHFYSNFCGLRNFPVKIMHSQHFCPNS